MGFLSTSTPVFNRFWGISTALSQLQKNILQLAKSWECLVDQLRKVENTISNLPLNGPSIFQAQSLLFDTVKLVQILEKTATYAERVREEDPSQVEAYYPKLKALATPLIELIREFITKKSALEKFRCLGAFEIVSYNVRNLVRGYHRLVTDSIDYLPPRLKEEATPIKRNVDESITQLLAAYSTSV